MQTARTVEVLENFFLDNCLNIPDSNLNLLASGYIDSFSLLELVDYLESELNVSIKSTEINADNFATIVSIVEYIELNF